MYYASCTAMLAWHCAGWAGGILGFERKGARPADVTGSKSQAITDSAKLRCRSETHARKAVRPEIAMKPPKKPRLGARKEWTQSGCSPLLRQMGRLILVSAPDIPLKRVAEPFERPSMDRRERVVLAQADWSIQPWRPG